MLFLALLTTKKNLKKENNKQKQSQNRPKFEKHYTKLRCIK